MDLLFKICVGISLGLLIGTLFGGIKLQGKRKYSQEQINQTKNTLSKISTFTKYLTFISLVIGFIWCIYFLLIGIFQPYNIDYANNMAELIVAVLTVISIIFAFFEFMKRPEE